MVRGLCEGEFTALTPRQVVDGLDWPQFVALHLREPEEKRARPLSSGERAVSELEFRKVLAERRKKREEEKHGTPAGW